MRFGITSVTSIPFNTERGHRGTEEEFSRTICVSKNDKQIREFMNENNIKTTSSQAANELRIREWAIQKGCRVCWK
jgi:hypothetical protein